MNESKISECYKDFKANKRSYTSNTISTVIYKWCMSSKMQYVASTGHKDTAGVLWLKNGVLLVEQTPIGVCMKNGNVLYLHPSFIGGLDKLSKISYMYKYLSSLMIELGNQALYEPDRFIPTDKLTIKMIAEEVIK
jgi:hypothetical protein